VHWDILIRKKKDRKYCYSCDPSGPTSNDCYYTDYVNAFDEPVTVQCKPNHYFTGVTSEHDNGKEDRRFGFQCCKNDKYCATKCNLNGPVNKFEGEMSYQLKRGFAIIDAFSWHINSKE